MSGIAFTLVSNGREFKELKQALLDAKTVCYDLETMSGESNLDDGRPDSRVTMASYTLADGSTYVVPLSHPDGPLHARWRAALTALAVSIRDGRHTKIIAHNAKYDIRWTHSMTGIALENQIWWDTSMSSYILNENTSNRLKDVAVNELEVEYWDEVNLKDSENEDLYKLAVYNAKDTFYCNALVPLHKEKLEAEPRLARVFYYIGMPIIRTFTRMERNGIPLDIEVVMNEQDEAEKTVEETYGELIEIAEGEFGMNPDDYPTVTFASANAKWFQEFMDRSGLPVIKRTKTGNPSWDQYVLEEIGEVNELATTLLLHRRQSNRISKFFVPWLEKVNEEGRIHASFNPMITDDKYQTKKGTVTGRTSSSNPNLQQVNRNLTHCFGGVPGWMIATLDYAQIELRIAAWLARDKNMLEAIYKGVDLHTLMAAIITGKKMSEVTAEERQKAKAVNFGYLYEMGWQGFIAYAKQAYGVEVTPEEARNGRRQWFRTWSGMARWHQRQKATAIRYGFVRNPLGRKRRLPEIWSSNSYNQGHAERQAINAPVQSFASDLMLLALIEMDRDLDPDKARLIATVHDSAVLEVRADCWEEVVEQAARIMLTPCLERRFGVRFTVPLEVEAKIGTHWGAENAEIRTYRSEK